MKANKSENHSEIVERVVYIGKCTTVVTGGRRFSIQAIIIAGDGKGRVGVGLGKAPEVDGARSKASKEARRRMVKIPLKDGRTLHHDVSAEFCAAKVIMRSAPPGTGIIAGGPLRVIFELVGIKDVVAKSVGTSNPHNMIKAALSALANTHSPRYIAEKRGKKVSELSIIRKAKVAKAYTQAHTDVSEDITDIKHELAQTHVPSDTNVQTVLGAEQD